MLENELNDLKHANKEVSTVILYSYALSYIVNLGLSYQTIRFK